MAMNKKLPVFLQLVPFIICIFCFNLAAKAQSVYGPWYCSESNTCFIIQKKGLSSINEFENIRFKIKKDRMRILDAYNSLAWLSGSNFAWYSIDKLTADTLIISSISTCSLFDELMPDKTLIFTRCSSEDCMNKWMNHEKK